VLVAVRNRFIVIPAHIAVATPGVYRDAHGRIKRSTTARSQFQHTHPSPSTGKLSGSCPGYVIDHVTPLKCAGADSANNMQWQTRPEAKIAPATGVSDTKMVQPVLGVDQNLYAVMRSDGTLAGLVKLDDLAVVLSGQRATVLMEKTAQEYPHTKSADGPTDGHMQTK
jgi:hypothetical protein